MKKGLLTFMAVAFALVVVPKVNPAVSFMQLVHAATSNNTVAPTGGTDALDVTLLDDVVEDAATGETIHITEDMGISTLSCHFMRKWEASNTNLRMAFIYKDVHYEISIPAGTKLDPTIPWYGPMYLYANFGVNSQAVEGPTTYTIQNSDTLSEIARQFGISLDTIKALNADLAAQNYILPGQQVFLK